jgi:hypothetical protein
MNIDEIEADEAAQYYDGEEPGWGHLSFRRSIGACGPLRPIPKPERPYVVPFVAACSAGFPTPFCTGAYRTNGIRILAVMNLKRRPSYWAGRE